MMNIPYGPNNITRIYCRLGTNGLVHSMPAACCTRAVDLFVLNHVERIDYRHNGFIYNLSARPDFVGNSVGGILL
jgi:hypothetical protein